MPVLPTPPSPGDGASSDDTVAWVAEHLGDLTLEGPDGVRAGGHRGGQVAADTALATLDIAGYSSSRSTVLPENRRGASRLSPWIRHGLLQLPTVWKAVADAPSRDRSRYRDELLWQEYARHLYARVGRANGEPLRSAPPVAAPAPGAPWSTEDPWPSSMKCMEHTVGELHDDGWLVNQTRMWLSSQWAVRAGADWRAGEDEFFVHLLDGSRAANRLGWQWTVGTGSAKVYGFSRWQVEKRAPQLCRRCPLSDACPIQAWPDDQRLGSAAHPVDLTRGEIPAGPAEVEGSGGELTWLTAESLGRDDPALAADPDRPAVFVFDAPLLARLRLSGKRLVFLAECLGDIAADRPLEVRLGDPVGELAGVPLAATWAPVPGYATRAARLDVVESHPWPWLVRPRTAAVRSFSAWRRDVKA